jgi:hypothetical protein
MTEFISFFSQNKAFLLVIMAIAGILVGRIWSNKSNWGEITDPNLIIRQGKFYEVVNLYIPKDWTEDWIADSIICFKSSHRSFFVKYTRKIYVLADHIRFTDDGPFVGSYYQAVSRKTTTGLIVMKPVNMPT